MDQMAIELENPPGFAVALFFSNREDSDVLGHLNPPCPHRYYMDELEVLG
jgi:hypothetical protein